MPIQPIEKKTVVDIIVDQIKELVVKGELKPGNKLPSERKLAEMFDVSRPAIREALKVLISLGIVDRRNEGSYISNNMLKSIQDPLLFNLLIEESDFRELFEARKIIELEIVKLAIENITSKGLKKLEDNINNTEDNLDKPKKFTELDIKFHISMAEAAGNSVLLIFLHTIRSLLKQSIVKLLGQGNMMEIALEYHRKIFEAIKTGDEEKAKEYLLSHLNVAEEGILNKK